eukprot:m.139569 g.139569  ORF g.139569 m.139569 type:complete len:164 (+) comp24076_c0_seq4:1279-1770(+)
MMRPTNPFICHASSSNNKDLGPGVIETNSNGETGGEDEEPSSRPRRRRTTRRTRLLSPLTKPSPSSTVRKKKAITPTIDQQNGEWSDLSKHLQNVVGVKTVADVQAALKQTRLDFDIDLAQQDVDNSVQARCRVLVAVVKRHHARGSDAYSTLGARSGLAAYG